MSMLLINGLLKHAQHNPSQLAFSEGERSISYGQLLTQSKTIASHLKHHGVSSSDCVAILLPRGIDAVRSIYATLLLQAIYVPLDIQNPVDRLQYILQDVQPCCVLSQGARPKWLSDSIIWLDISDMTTPVSSISIEPVEGVNPSKNTAAILYTSGSTGNPKGVSISWQAIQAFVNWTAETFHIQTGDHIASLAPFHFDLSLFDLFTSIYCAASVHFIPQQLTMAPKKLVDWLENKYITMWYTVPSILNFITLRGGLAPERLPALKHILFAGEVFPQASLIRLVQALPHVQFYNLFGPTETNVCTYWPVQLDTLLSTPSIPIGIAACEAELIISDDGELLVRGPCVTHGYWYHGRLNPRADDWYHTGDKVSRNVQGEYLYHGRMDRMIKSSGYRIEPAEIEQHMNGFEGVIASVVMGEADPISGQRLLAVIEGDTVDISQLRQHLKASVPSYMQPYRIIKLDQLPRMSNGKINLQALKQQINKPKQ